MPGLAGCVVLTKDLPLPFEVISRLTRPLMHESLYSVQPIRSTSESVAVIVNPEIDNMICGTARHPGAGVSLGFYGEFHDPACQEAKCGNDVAEKLIRKYLERGDNFPQSLDGSYVVFVADDGRKRTLLFNDYYASRPVFYGVQDGRFYFSPEAKGVARMHGFDAGIDEDALAAFLVNGNPLAEQTFYKNVKPLPPGTVLTIEDGRVIRTESSRYAPCADTNDRGDDYYVQGLSELLLKAVGKQLRNPDKAVVPLSGGIDSRLIAGCVSRITGGNLHTVSWGVDETLPNSDTVVARQVASSLASDHHFVRRESEHLQRDMSEMLFRIDGLNDDPAVHSNELCIMRRIREEFGGLYVLRGEECFGHTPEPTCDLEALGHWGIARLEDHPRAQRLLNPSKLPAFRDHFAQMMQGILDACPSVNLTDRRDYFYFACRLFHYHSRSAYCKRTVVDVRNPWLDRELLEFLQTVPVRYRINRYLYKRAGSAMFPELMAIPIASRNSLENWPQKFQNDADLQQLVRKHLFERRNSLHEILNLDTTRDLYEETIRAGGARPSLKVRTLQAGKTLLRTHAPELYRQLKRSLMGKMEPTAIAGEMLLMRILLLKIWFDQFVDGNAQPEDFRLLKEAPVLHH